MSPDLDFELIKYDFYQSYAQVSLHRGMAKQAHVFESLADLCYEKAQLMREADHMIDQWVQRSAWPSSELRHPRHSLAVSRHSLLHAMIRMDAQVLHFEQIVELAHIFVEEPGVLFRLDFLAELIHPWRSSAVMRHLRNTCMDL